MGSERVRMHRVGWRQAATQAALLVVVGASGCGRPLGTLEGDVTFENEPVAAGIVMLFPTDGNYRNSSSVRIADGRYRITGIVPGKRRVSLQHLELHAAADGKPRHVPDSDGSYPETIEVAAGRQSLNFELRMPGKKQ